MRKSMHNLPLPPIWNVVLFGITIFTLFFAFIPAQAFATVTFGTFGALGVIILYTFFCLSNLTAPWVVKKLGVSISMALGGLGYVPFVLAISTESKILFIIGSVTCGAGAALLWVGIGTSVTYMSSAATRGRRFGVFSFVNRLNFVGSLTVGVLFSTGSTREQVFLYLTIVLIVACFLIGLFGYLVLTPLEKKCLAAAKLQQEEQEEQEEHEEAITTSSNAININQMNDDDNRTDFSSILRIFTDKKFVPFLITNFLVCGFVKGWVFAVMTTFAPDLSSVGYMMSLYGCFVVIR